MIIRSNNTLGDVEMVSHTVGKENILGSRTSDVPLRSFDAVLDHASPTTAAYLWMHGSVTKGVCEIKNQKESVFYGKDPSFIACLTGQADVA